MKLRSSFCRAYLFARRVHNPIFLLCMFTICFYGCKKTDEVSSSNSNTAPANNGSVAITPVGTPEGNPVSKIIGAAGGTLVSADSVVELNIPPGALSSDVNVTIQPLTNEAPGGIGLSYDFLPNGTVFSTPATATFHYSDDSLNGTLPELLWILYQDSSNAWQANPELQDLDTVAKKLHIEIGHFSARSISKNVEISASKLFLHKNDQSTLTVEQTIFGKAPANQTGMVTVGAISYLETVPNQNVWNWQVHEDISGTGAPIGNISATTGAEVTYNAPPQINNTILVRVTATVGPITEWKGKTKIITPFVTLTRFLLLEANEFNYSVFFAYRDPHVAGYLSEPQLYEDSATFDLTITIHPDAPPNQFQNVATASIKNIHNNGPAVTPLIQNYTLPDGDIYTWTFNPDPIGLYNIQNVTLDDSLIDSDLSLFLQFNSDVAESPSYWGLDEPEDGGVKLFVKSVQLNGGIPAITTSPLIINNKVQVIGDPKAGQYFVFTPKQQ
jgi:hypothetical protein